jgi:hypothetical protein
MIFERFLYKRRVSLHDWLDENNINTIDEFVLKTQMDNLTISEKTLMNVGLDLLSRHMELHATPGFEDTEGEPPQAPEDQTKPKKSKKSTNT